MRTIRPVPLVAVATAALALAPASALARRQAQQGADALRGCHVRLEVSKVPVAPGEIVIGGKVACVGDPEPDGLPVTLYARSTEPLGPFSAESPVTTEKGSFSVKLPGVERDTTVYALSEGAKSAKRTIRVSALVTPLTPPTPAEGAQLLTGDGGRLQAAKTVEFAGTVKPFFAGERVVLQRESSTGNEEWRAIQFGEVNGEGKYSFKHRFLVPGEANIRVLVHPQRLNAPSASTPASYEISQVQNPQLTLESNADPLSFGQKAMLKGLVAGITKPTGIVLVGHTGDGHSSSTSLTTSASGSYEVAVEPTQNTIYQAKLGSTKSALLFEGVKHQLTFTPPASTATAGQVVEFSGAVLPGFAGRVYLERQNAGQLGWHVIDSTSVAASGEPLKSASPFSIKHVFNIAGPEHLRIKVPGGGGHQAIASAPFDVNVAAAPASALTPEAPSSTPHLPPNGQV